MSAVGHFVSWEGGCLFLSRDGGVVPAHAHYAIQVAFGSEPGIGFRASDRDPWTTYDAAIIASRQPHSMDARHVRYSAVLFVEPETVAGRALAERFATQGIAPLPFDLLAEAAPALFRAWHEERTVASLVDAGRRVVRALTGGMQPADVSDERILRAVRYVKANLHASLTLDEVAAEACLSPSRFRHLFVEQTGMALRPYILWRRFIHVWELLMNGSSLSAAAHAAGFADAAHLSRTSRRTFGFPPSALQMAGPLPAGEVSAADNAYGRAFTITRTPLAR